MSTSVANIWTAASEGDLARVTYLVEQEGISPNAYDENSYTPIHASASWNHPDILRYLISKGGDINLKDEDGETCLFVIENVEMCRAFVELGGDVAIKNEQGLTAAESLLEDFPQLSLYLNSLSSHNNTVATPTLATSSSGIDSQPDLDTPTDALLQRVEQIMRLSEAGQIDSTETDAQLRTVVEEAVLGQVEIGKLIGQQQHLAEEAGNETGAPKRELDSNGVEVSEIKRSREDDDEGVHPPPTEGR